MKRTKGTVPSWVIFTGVALVAVGAIWAFSKGGTAPGKALAPPVVSALPTGRLQLLSVELGQSTYISLDDLTREGASVLATVLVVGQHSNSLQDKFALMVRRDAIDCERRTVLAGRPSYFDGEGKFAAGDDNFVALPRNATAADLQVVRACANPQPVRMSVAGYRIAQENSQLPPEPVAENGWSWRCAAAARQVQQEDPRAICNKAVDAQPDDMRTRLNRAFLNLKSGFRAEAREDFAAILARDPANPEALFGRSLVRAIGGDQIGGQRDRVAALEVYPEIGAEIEQAYRFFIDTKYKQP